MFASPEFSAVRGLAACRVPTRARAAMVGLTIGASVVLALLPSKAPVAAAEPNQVAIDNFTFTPTVLTVKVGASVTWTNRDDIPHTVRADDGSFKSSALDTGDTYSHTFTNPGEYSYFCSLHPRMTGKVVVETN